MEMTAKKTTKTSAKRIRKKSDPYAPLEKEILINLVNVEIDRKEIIKKFGILHISMSDKQRYFAANAILASDTEHCFLSCSYVSPKKLDKEGMYLLYDRRNQSKVKKVLQELMQEQTEWKWAPVRNLSALTDGLITQLLLNAQPYLNPKKKQTHYGIAAACLLRKDVARNLKDFVCLELELMPFDEHRLIVKNRVKTLYDTATVERYIEQIKDENAAQNKETQIKPIYEYYTFKNGFIERISSNQAKEFKESRKDKIYCAYRNITGTPKKHMISAYRFDTKELWHTCKSYWITSCIEEFNSYLEGLAHLEFEVTQASSHQEMNKILKDNDSEYRNMLCERTIELADCSIDRLTKESLEQITAFIEKQGIHVIHNDHPSGTYPILKFVDEPNSYKLNNIADPYKDHTYKVCQHILLTSLLKTERDKILEKSIDELMLKQDLVNHKITLFDWTKYAEGKRFRFGKCASIRNEKTKKMEQWYYILDISPQGDMSFNFSPDLMEDSAFMKTLVQAADKAALIMESDECCMALYHTDLHPLPNYKFLNDPDSYVFPTKEQISSLPIIDEHGHTKKIRSKIKGKKLYLHCAGLIEINQYKNIETNQTGMYYSAGITWQALKGYTFNTFPNIYKVEVIDGQPDTFEKYEELITIPFVRLKTQTVQPFLVKYLNEALKMYLQEECSKQDETLPF
jgi:hypothetical protein